jgi:hypothetical protein
MLWLSLLIALSLSLIAGFLLYKADKKRAVPYPAVTASLRGLLIGLTVLLLLAPQIRKRSTHTQKPVIVFLQDDSRSVAAALGENAAKYRQDISTLNNKLAAKFTLVTRTLEHAVPADSLFDFRAPATNIAAALEEVTELYGQQNLGAIVLASDGRYNQGANPEYLPLPMNGMLYALAIGDTTQQQDLRIGKLYYNKTVGLNNQFELRADVVAKGAAGYRDNITLKDESGNVLATAPVYISADRFDGTVSFTIKAAKAGLRHYTISAPVAGTEKNTENNRAAAFVTVTETKKKILLLAASPHPDLKAISEALQGIDEYELETRIADRLPENLGDYHCIILHQLPALGTGIGAAWNTIPKSTWYITGVQSNFPQLNQMQQMVQFRAGNVLHDADPEWNNTFSLFSLPADIAAIVDKLPPLSIPSGEWSGSAAVQPLFRQASGLPLWSFYTGNVPAAFLFGEGLWRWRMYEYKATGKHEVIDECIRQTISFLTADNKSKPFRTELPKYVWTGQEFIQVAAYLYNSNNELLNTPDATISISDSAGKARNFNFEKNGNSYRINIGALPAGNYRYKAQVSYNGKNFVDEGNFAVTATELEAQETGCDYALLHALAQKNNGTVFSTAQTSALYDSLLNNTNIRPLITETEETAPLVDWKWYFFLVLLLATAEWLLRKYWMAM